MQIILLSPETEINALITAQTVHNLLTARKHTSTGKKRNMMASPEGDCTELSRHCQRC